MKTFLLTCLLLSVACFTLPSSALDPLSPAIKLWKDNHNAAGARCYHEHMLIPHKVVNYIFPGSGLTSPVNAVKMTVRPLRCVLGGTTWYINVISGNGKYVEYDHVEAVAFSRNTDNNDNNGPNRPRSPFEKHFNAVSNDERSFAALTPANTNRLRFSIKSFRAQFSDRGLEAPKCLHQTRGDSFSIPHENIDQISFGSFYAPWNEQLHPATLNGVVFTHEALKCYIQSDPKNPNKIWNIRKLSLNGKYFAE